MPPKVRPGPEGPPHLSPWNLSGTLAGSGLHRIWSHTNAETQVPGSASFLRSPYTWRVERPYFLVLKGWWSQQGRAREPKQAHPIQVLETAGCYFLANENVQHSAVCVQPIMRQAIIQHLSNQLCRGCHITKILGGGRAPVAEQNSCSGT